MFGFFVCLSVLVFEWPCVCFVVVRIVVDLCVDCWS